MARRVLQEEFEKGVMRLEVSSTGEKGMRGAKLEEAIGWRRERSDVTRTDVSIDYRLSRMKLDGHWVNHDESGGCDI